MCIRDRLYPQGTFVDDVIVHRLAEDEYLLVINCLLYTSIARAIVRSRPIRSTAHLADVISAAARPMNSEQRRIHPATRTFQALRIFVNRELDDLRALLDAAPRVLKPGGRVVVISFHSLEDRIVKDAFRDGAKQGYFSLLTKKPLTATEEESDRNPRARSAKLRVAEKV